MSSNRLNGTRAYLCGPLDRAEPKHLSWRGELTPWLENCGVTVLDPTKKPIEDYNENNENRLYRAKLKSSGKFSDLSYLMKQIIRMDLRLCDVADFLIVYINLDVFSCGTIHEVVLMAQQRKPILIFCEQGISNIPDWLFGLCNYKEFFNNISELTEYLSCIDQGNIEPNNKWVFFNQKAWLCN